MHLNNLIRIHIFLQFCVAIKWNKNVQIFILKEAVVLLSIKHPLMEKITQGNKKIVDLNTTQCKSHNLTA